VNSNGTAFVDDSFLGVTSTYRWDPALTSVENHNEEIAQIMGQLRHLAQHWECLLFSTGGAIITQKSHWYILTWRWKNGNTSLLNSVPSLSTLNFTSGYETRAHPVPSLPATSAYCTLDIHISPSGSQTQQIKVLRSHANEYHSAISNSILMPDEAYWSYILYLQPRLTYPLACTSLMEKQCHHVQAPTLAALLPNLHLNRHTPHSVVFGDAKFGGLSLPHLYTDQGFQQLRFFIGHLCQQDEMRKLILIAISFLQLILGVQKPFFTLRYAHFAKWVEEVWVTSIWQHTSQLNMFLEVEHH
jgi:hypothetical protein